MTRAPKGTNRSTTTVEEGLLLSDSLPAFWNGNLQCDRLGEHYNVMRLDGSSRRASLDLSRH